MAEGLGENIQSTTLGREDLDTILSKLNLFPKREWMNFGLKAGLYEPTLSDIEANYPKDVERCFTKTVSRWLKRRDGVDKKGIPTWLRLGDILEEMGEKDLADKIRKQGTGTSVPLSKSDSAGITKPVEYIVPPDLSIEYSKLNNQFSSVLGKFASEIIQGKLLEDFKAFLLGRSPHQSEGREREGTEREDEIIKVCDNDKCGLVSLLRKYFFLSNFGALIFFAEEYNFVASQTLLDFSEKIDDFYKKTLAQDFAQQAIEDHKKMEYHGEVIFKVDLDLKSIVGEFQKFLVKAFYHHHGIFIALRVVQQSVLTFVCTIPKWLVEEMKEYVAKNEEMLKSKKVVELIIDGTVMFSVKHIAKETKEEDETTQDTFESLPQEIRVKIQELRDKEEPINILLIGPTGSGKSTILNALMGKDVTRVWHGAESFESAIEEYEGEVMGVKIKVYDSVGFGDTRGRSGKYILEEMAKENKLDLILICWPCISRVTYAMRVMFETINEEMCERMVVVLTFTNMFLQFGSVEEMTDKEKERAIHLTINKFKAVISKSLSPEFTFRNIQFCIAGLLHEMKLPTTDNWLEALWGSCISRCSDRSRPVLKLYSKQRLLQVTELEKH